MSLECNGYTYSDYDLTGIHRAGYSEEALALAQEDFESILYRAAHNEVAGLREAIVKGEIDGSTYSGGSCRCLVGTIAKIRGCHYESMLNIRPDEHRPAEQWFMSIVPGDDPDNSIISRISLGWLDNWVAKQVAKQETNP